jgi:hypothetical protein
VDAFFRKEEQQRQATERLMLERDAAIRQQEALDAAEMEAEAQAAREAAEAEDEKASHLAEDEFTEGERAEEAAAGMTEGAVGALALRMRAALPTKDRAYAMRTYKACFLGEDAVQWLLAPGPGGGGLEAEAAALAVGRRLLEEGCFEHVAVDGTGRDGARGTLQNGFVFYRFRQEPAAARATEAHDSASTRADAGRGHRAGAGRGSGEQQPAPVSPAQGGAGTAFKPNPKTPHTGAQRRRSSSTLKAGAGAAEDAEEGGARLDRRLLFAGSPKLQRPSSGAFKSAPSGLTGAAAAAPAAAHWLRRFREQQAEAAKSDSTEGATAEHITLEDTV